MIYATDTAQTNAETAPSGGKAGAVPARYSNGWLQRMDHRYELVRFMRDRFAAIASDLGGPDNLSVLQCSLIERTVFIEYWIFQQEQSLATGAGEFDPGKWTQAVNSFSGLAAKLGLERRAKDVPDLRGYLAEKQGAQA